MITVRRAAIAVFSVCVLAALAACDLALGLGELKDRRPDLDGGNDAAIDAGGADDAAIDAGFCPTPGAMMFCDDFDGKFDAGWQIAEPGGGLVELSDALFVSPPHALRTDRPGVEVGVIAGAVLYRSVDPKIKRAVVDADIRACAPTRGFINHLSFYDEGKGGVAIGSAFNGVPKAFAAAATTDFGAPSFGNVPLPTHRFAHVRWTVLFDPSLGSMKVELDGETIIDVQNIATTADDVKTRVFQVGVMSGDGSACEVHVDNLAVSMAR